MGKVAFDDFVLNDEEIAALIAGMDRVKTPEEIAREKEEHRREILSKGFLPINDELDETMSSPMEEVEKNPRRFIIEECVCACCELWRKNIYTFMVSDHLNEGVCWIEIDEDNLSEENKEILMRLEGEDIIRFSYHPGCINFGVNCVGDRARERLLELAKQFQIQDVPHGSAYLTLSEYLISCGCYDEVENPDYEPMTPPWEKELSFDELAKYMSLYDEWKLSNRSVETNRIFNPSKVTKPLDEYFKDRGGIYDGDRVYLSEYHYKKHLNYVSSLTQDQSPKHKM